MMNMRIGALLVGMLMALTPCMAQAELAAPQAPDGHIAKTLTVDGMEVRVDADIYGADIKEVQAYRVERLDLGEEPEKSVDLSAFFGDDPIVERRTLGGEDDLVFETEGGAKIWLSPQGVLWKSKNEGRLGTESFDWGESTSYYPERLRMDDLAGMSAEACVQKLAPVLDELGVAAESMPFDGVSIGLDALNAATEARLAHGVAPHEDVVEDWTEADEHVRLRLAIRYRGLQVMPWSEHTEEGITPETYIHAWIGRRGVERFQTEFVPGEDEALDDPFVPLTAEEALTSFAERAKSRWTMWGYGEPSCSGIRDAHVGSMRLGYVMMPEAKRAGADEGYIARPAWFFAVYFETTAMQAVSLEQPEPHAEAMRAMKAVAIDARTGEMLLDF